MADFRSQFLSPRREWAIILLVAVALALYFSFPGLDRLLLVAAVIGTVPLALRAVRDLTRLRITIDVFNLLALGASYATWELPSAAFIILMITSADLLDWRTSQRSKRAVQRLLELKPQTALRQTPHGEERIRIDQVQEGDVLVVPAGEAVPADGVVIAGEADVNEAFVTGESVPVHKVAGSRVLISSVAESGALKVRAMRVGAESTLERMAKLIREASAHKSKPERLADRFAGIFLPAVIVLGGIVYFVTRDLRMTAALFLVACADDMAVAIPLAMTAALGQAARRGVVVKGGAALDVLARVRTVVLDKTGTLTYGQFRFKEAAIAPGIEPDQFWRAIGTADKFSDHPIARALLQEAYRHVADIPDPDRLDVRKGSGIIAYRAGQTVAIGNRDIAAAAGVALDADALKAVGKFEDQGTVVLVCIDGRYAGVAAVADIPRTEAAASVERLTALGVGNVIMFTGDNETAARHVGDTLHIRDVRSGMKPEEKLRALERIRDIPVAMVGDGINDAPALARADVGIAMGGQGTAIASEAADVVVLTDNLARVPELIVLGRRTMGVIRSDIVIWGFTNVLGFVLVLTGVFGPAWAAFYNFATDFLPLVNSSRLFRGSRMVE